MPRRAAFIPPRINPLVLGLGKAALPALFRWHAGGIEVSISDADLATLRKLKGQRLLLLPNHPTHFDPLILLEISRQVEEDFCFVAAREVFDRHMVMGWLMQRCGIYSLVRGAVDRESFATTQRILAEGRHWLVIFIEGESTLDNDHVIPFEAGVLSLALRTQDKLADGAGLFTVPVAMRTLYQPGVEHAIVGALGRLEDAVGVPRQSSFRDWPDTRRRMVVIGDALLRSVERTYLLTSEPGDSIESRMAALKNRLLSKMEGYLDIAPAADTPFLERVRMVRNRMDRIVHTYGDDPEKTPPYERRLLELRRLTFVEFYRDLSRLINFLTLRGDYLLDASPERFAEVTIRLEQEILGQPQLVYPRTTTVRLGSVRDLRAALPAFRADKRQASTAITEALETEMAALLQQMKPAPA